MRRFTFTQPWSGAYQVRVGCGGTTGDWGITAQSTYRDESYRKLECDDADPTSADAPSCADLFD
jgi:hypothetical protein